MILVDRRIGSEEVLPLIQKRDRAIPVELSDLPFGDFCFEGQGPNGHSMVGIERKRVKDMMNSIRSGRFSGHQLPGMLQFYQFQYLIIEGIFRPNPLNGMLEEWHGRGGWNPVCLGSIQFMYREIDQFLNTIERKTPVRVHRVSTPAETAFQVVDLYKWWTDKSWEAHRAHQAFQEDNHVEIFKPSMVRQVAALLPGIDWVISKAVDEHFHGSMTAMLQATPDEWQGIKGIGPTKARSAVEALHS